MTALLLLAGATISYVHGDKGPHGGQMVASGYYYVELLNKEGKVTVYLLDANEKTKGNKGITSSVVFQFTDKTNATVKHTANGDEKFNADNDKASAFTSCVVTIKVNGKTITANFAASVEKKKEPEVKPHGRDHGDGGRQY